MHFINEEELTNRFGFDDQFQIIGIYVAICGFVF